MIAGQKLRAFREKRDVTQAAVARELGLTRNAVADMEGRTVGLQPAENYLNAVSRHLERAGSGDDKAPGFRRYAIRVQIGVESVGPLSADETAELHDIASLS